MPTIINWAACPHKGGAFESQHHELQILFQEPENLFVKLRASRAESKYLKCYALLDILKNTYIVTAPLDLTIKYDRENKWLSVDGVDQQLYESNFLNRAGDFSETDPALVTCPPRYIFYSDTPVKMTIWPTPFFGEIENTRVVVGGFDIYKWVRPIDWTFEIVDDKKEVVIKRGDPLFAVNFSTFDNSKVELNRVPYDSELHNIASSCVSLKRLIKQVPLKKCYEMAESFITMWRRHRK